MGSPVSMTVAKLVMEDMEESPNSVRRASLVLEAVCRRHLYSTSGWQHAEDLGPPEQY